MPDTSYTHTIWKQNLYTCWTARCITNGAYQFLVPFIPLMVQNMGVGTGFVDVVAGMAVSAPGLFVGLVAPFWGYAADRLGHKVMVLRALVASAILFFLFSITKSVGMLITLRVLQGMFTGLIASSIALVSVSTPAEYQNRALRTLATSNLLTSTFVPAVSGAIVLAVGIAPTLRVGSLVVLVVGIISFFFIVDPTTKTQRQTMVAHTKKETRAGRKISPFIPKYKNVFRGTIVASGLLNFLRASPTVFALLIVLKFVPPERQEVFSSITLGALGIWTLASTYCIPYAANKISKSIFSFGATCVVCIVIIGIGVLMALPFLGYRAYFIISALALGISAGVDVLMQEVLGKISYSEHKGNVFGKLTFVGGIGRFSGTMIVSAFSGWLGVTAASVLLIALLIAIVVVLILLRKEEKHTGEMI